MQNGASARRISDFGLIGNTRTGALVSRQGAIDWLCFPRFDSPSVFGALLDPSAGGAFQISPSTDFQSEQSYIEDTNVLRTRFRSASGVADLIDCFTVATEREKRSQLFPQHEVLRIVEGCDGTVEFRLTFAPRPNYSNAKYRISQRGRCGLRIDLGNEIVNLCTSLPTESFRISESERDQAATVEFAVRAGERHFFSLIHSAEAPAVIAPLGESALNRLQSTIAYWRSWIGGCAYAGNYEPYVKRSALALKLLVFSPSGAIVAAPTTSLPEYIGGERNWDYRYCWLRDASWTMRALLSLGFDAEAEAYMSWLLHATVLSRPRLQVLYDVYGKKPTPERVIREFDGFLGSHPVRIGNEASNQQQLDVYGEVMDAAYAFALTGREFDRDTKDFLIDLGSSVLNLWNQPDHGIWEIRSEQVHHTHSKVLAWVALDRLVKLCQRFGWRAPVAQYQAAMVSLRQMIESRGFNDRLGSYTRLLDGADVDASLLLMPLLEYCDPLSPRTEVTRRSIVRALSENGLVYRYKNVDDGLKGAEGAFAACSFWLSANYAMAGDVASARRWFDAIASRSNSLMLFPEEFNVESGEYLGNYPQAFTHIALINAAARIGERESQPERVFASRLETVT